MLVTFLEKFENVSMILRTSLAYDYTLTSDCMGCRFTFYSLFMDIQNSFLNIHNSFLDIKK